MKLDDEFNKLFSGTTVLEDVVPGLQYVWESGRMRLLKSMKKEFVDEYIGTKFQEHKDSFDKGAVFSPYYSKSISRKSQTLIYRNAVFWPVTFRHETVYLKKTVDRLTLY